MSAAARASKKWIWVGAGLAISGAGYLLYYGPGRKVVFEAKQPATASQALSAPDGLDPNAFRSFKLSNIKTYNHNTNVFTFAFDDPKAKYNGKTASCVMLKANIDGKDVVRPYTPISRPNTIGQLEFVIKDYPQGTLSKYVHNMKKGDTIDIKGPVPKYPYEANKFQKLGLIAGGTGITPMVQMIEEVLFNPDDKTKITLLFANSSLNDILLKQDLDKLAQKYPDRLKVYYTVSKLAEEKDKKAWKGEIGYITEDMLKKVLPTPSKKDDESLLVMVCGPPAFMKLISGEKTKDYKQGELSGLLKNLGFTEKNRFDTVNEFRKRIKPVIDEDDERRDVFVRKRVDVIECLLESSSDENDETNIRSQNSKSILWLTFAEICHIRSVLAVTTLSTVTFNEDKQYSKFIHGNLCVRCRKQRICRKCSLSNFAPALSTYLFPVRIQTLIKSSSSISIFIEHTKSSQQSFSSPMLSSKFYTAQCTQSNHPCIQW